MASPLRVPWTEPCSKDRGCHRVTPASELTNTTPRQCLSIWCLHAAQLWCNFDATYLDSWAARARLDNTAACKNEGDVVGGGISSRKCTSGVQKLDLQRRCGSPTRRRFAKYRAGTRWVPILFFIEASLGDSTAAN